VPARRERSASQPPVPPSSRRFPPDPAGPFEYDIAISFLHQDLDVAHKLEARLTPALKVFVYDRHSEELLAGDGMDAFTEVFRYQSRLHLILQREGYGDTPWTHFELGHIKDRFLLMKQQTALVINLDQSSADWLHPTYLYLSDANDFAEAMAVIKYRAQELGAQLRRLSPAEEAAAAAAAARRRAERDQILFSDAGVRLAQQELAALYAEIERHLDELLAVVPDFPVQREINATGQAIFIRSPHVSTRIWWTTEWVNSLQHAHLDVVELEGPISLPSDVTPYRNAGRPTRESEYSFSLTDHLKPCWTLYGKRDARPEEQPSTMALAEAIVRRHLTRHEESIRKRRPR
jgi:hypothetical protein